VDHVAGRHRKPVEVVLDRRHVVIGIGGGPVHHVLEVAVVVRLGSAAVVVAVVVQDDEQRPVRVGVELLVLIHHLLVLQGPIAAAAVFISLVAGPRHGHDLLRGPRVWIDVLHLVRPVAERRAHLARGPEIVELHPRPARSGGVRIDGVGAIRGVEVGRIRVRVVLRGPVEVDVVHDRPVEPLGHERGDHPRAEGGLGRKVALGVRHTRAEGVLGGELVELDLHPQVAGVEQGAERVVLREPDQVEPGIAPGRGQRPRLAVRLLPVVPLRVAGRLEIVEVLDQRPGERHARPEMGERGADLDGVLGPGRVGPQPLVVDVDDGEREPARVGRLDDALAGVVDRLVHVPEEADLHRGLLGDGRHRPEPRNHRQRQGPQTRQGEVQAGSHGSPHWCRRNIPTGPGGRRPYPRLATTAGRSVRLSV
jgi:hypothetical protein